MPEAPATPAAGTVEPVPGSQKPPETTPPTTETKPEETSATPPTPEEEAAEFDVKNVKKEGDKLVWRVDPEDPKSSVYTGKDFDELLSNVAAGIKAKDSYIRQNKATKIVADKTAFDPSKTKEEHFPELAEIEEEVVKAYAKHGITPEMFRWGKKEWREYEIDNGALDALRMSQQIDRANQEIQTRYAQVNLAQINKSILDDETEAVQEMVEELGIDPEEDGFDFLEVLNRVWADDKNKRNGGILKNGRIVREAEKELRKIATEKLKSQTRRQTDEEVAKANLEKEKAGTVESPTKPAKPTPKTPATTEDALKEVLAEFQKKK